MRRPGIVTRSVATLSGQLLQSHCCLWEGREESEDGRCGIGFIGRV